MTRSTSIWKEVIATVVLSFLVVSGLFGPHRAELLRCDRETGSERCTLEKAGAEPVVYENLWAVRTSRDKGGRYSPSRTRLELRNRTGVHEVATWIEHDDAKRIASWYAGKEPRVEVARAAIPSHTLATILGLALMLVVVVVRIIQKLVRRRRQRNG